MDENGLAGRAPADPIYGPRGEAHRSWLIADARRQLSFFRASLRADGGFDNLDLDGQPLADRVQVLHTTTRLVHAFALARALGEPGTHAIIDAGLDRLCHGHRDERFGGYAWSIDGRRIVDGTKFAYGHVFVLLAAASARKAGHPDADRLLADVATIIEERFWDEASGRLRDEFAADWTPFSTYRGMNANMHGVEAFLAAFEATGERLYLERAGRILDFFVHRMAPEHGWRLPEHYTRDWQVDLAYQGDPMFRPAGTTPGHSFEFARLALQHWDLSGRHDETLPASARKLFETAHSGAWNADAGGYAYTLAFDGTPLVRDRYWWPVTEAIGALSALALADPRPSDAGIYCALWRFADIRLIDHKRGGWFPELDAQGRPTDRQFQGKPDLYHSLQAALLPLVPGLSRLYEGLETLSSDTPSGR